jgi:hypothetical protein
MRPSRAQHLTAQSRQRLLRSITGLGTPWGRDPPFPPKPASRGALYHPRPGSSMLRELVQLTRLLRFVFICAFGC